MPYTIVKDHPDCPASKPWAVVKEDSGEKIGCNETKGDAEDQKTAIEISESKGQEGGLDERSTLMSDKQTLVYTRAMVDLGDTGQRSAKKQELLDDLSMPVPFVASTEGIKADGINLKMEDWDLKRFKRYGPVMWVHDYWHPPLGTGVATADDKLRMDVHFDRADEFAMLIRGKAIKGMMAGSVGWFQKKNEKNELIEFSMTPLGLDPDALPDIQRSGLRAVRAEISEVLKETEGASMVTLISELRDEIMAGMTEALNAFIELDQGRDEMPEEDDPKEEEIGETEESEKDLPESFSGLAIVEWPRGLPELSNGSAFIVHENQIWQPTYTNAANADQWERIESTLEEIESLDDAIRAGAVLSKKNLDDLARALELIRGVIDRATPAEEEPVVVSDEEREEEIEDVDIREEDEEIDESEIAYPGIVTEIVGILENQVEGD